MVSDAGLDLLIYRDPFRSVHDSRCLYPGSNEKLRPRGQVLVLYSSRHLL